MQLCFIGGIQSKLVGANQHLNSMSGYVFFALSSLSVD